ncbi:hypothetical protein FXO37_17191 [Capsicum annuum]|nr:hypothetical protein FXO37_17191 [Capsicum annuum]
MPKSSYGVHLVSSMDPLVVPTSAYGTPQTSSSIPPSVHIYEHGTPISEVQTSSMLPPRVDSEPAKFTMPLIVVSIVKYSEVQKRFERSTHLGILRFSVVVSENA